MPDSQILELAVAYPHGPALQLTKPDTALESSSCTRCLSDGLNFDARKDATVHQLPTVRCRSLGRNTPDPGAPCLGQAMLTPMPRSLRCSTVDLRSDIKRPGLAPSAGSRPTYCQRGHHVQRTCRRMDATFGVRLRRAYIAHQPVHESPHLSSTKPRRTAIPGNRSTCVAEHLYCVSAKQWICPTTRRSSTSLMLISGVGNHLTTGLVDPSTRDCSPPLRSPSRERRARGRPHRRTLHRTVPKATKQFHTFRLQ